MKSHLLPQHRSQLLRSSAACALFLAHVLVMADSTSGDATRALPRSDSGNMAAHQTPADSERFFLPESAFVQSDPDAPAPKLLAPLRPTARTVEPDTSIVPQTKSRARAASDTSGQSMITHTGTATQAGEINRVELKRQVKPPAEPEKLTIEKTVVEKAVIVSALPEQISTPTPSLPNRSGEAATIKLKPAPIYKSIATQTNPAVPYIKNKAPGRLPGIERDYRLQHDVTAATPAETTEHSASISQSEEDFLAAKNSLADSTARLREIERTINDMQQMLPSPTNVQSSTQLLAALPYASVTAQNSSAESLSQQPNWLTNGYTSNANASSENTAHANNKQPPLGQWGLLQLILLSVVAGIAGYVLLNRSSTGT